MNAISYKNAVIFTSAHKNSIIAYSELLTTFALSCIASQIIILFSSATINGHSMSQAANITYHGLRSQPILLTAAFCVFAIYMIGKALPRPLKDAQSELRLLEKMNCNQESKCNCSTSYKTKLEDLKKNAVLKFTQNVVTHTINTNQRPINTQGISLEFNEEANNMTINTLIDSVLSKRILPQISTANDAPKDETNDKTCDFLQNHKKEIEKEIALKTPETDKPTLGGMKGIINNK